MDREALAELMTTQDGVVSRRQALAHGATPADLRRLVRRREWSRLHPGVYVDHTGPPTWQQRAWAAVLFAAPRGPVLPVGPPRGERPRPPAA